MPSDDGAARANDLSQFSCAGDDEGPCKNQPVVTLTGYTSHYVKASEFAALCGHHARLHRESLKDAKYAPPRQASDPDGGRDHQSE